MVNTSKKQEENTSKRSKQALKSPEIQRWEALNRIRESEDYQQHLKPILEAAQLNKWLDPNQLDKQGQPLFPTVKEFHKVYTEAYGRAKAFEELQIMIDGSQKILENLSEQTLKKSKYEF